MRKLSRTRPRRALPAVAVTILAAGLLTACGGKSTNSGTSSGGGKGQTTIGFVYKLPNPYFNAMVAAVKQWSSQNNVHLLVAGGKTPTDVQGQISAIQTMISQGAKALVVSPQGPQLIPTLDRAISQHIPVVLVNEPLPGWSGQTSYVGTDNYKGAVLAGQGCRWPYEEKPGACPASPSHG